MKACLHTNEVCWDNLLHTHTLCQWLCMCAPAFSMAGEEGQALTYRKQVWATEMKIPNILPALVPHQPSN